MIFKSSDFNHPKMKFVPKGWGWERWIVNKEEYCGKLLYIAKDRRCSLHYHEKKDETFYLQSGKIEVYYSDDIKELERIMSGEVFVRKWEDYVHLTIMNPGDNFYVPKGRVHQMVAVRDSELFEFSTQHFDEDSIRLVKGD